MLAARELVSWLRERSPASTFTDGSLLTNTHLMLETPKLMALEKTRVGRFCKKIVNFFLNVLATRLLTSVCSFPVLIGTFYIMFHELDQ